MANIISLCDVPISPTHQLDFANKTQQNNYFDGKVNVSFQSNYIPRTDRLEVRGFTEELANCNYGFYVNNYKGYSKRYYFWIVSREMISRECTLLTIQLDVFQTWLFEMKLQQCFIERGHVSDDTIGLHTQTETFELGEYVVRNTYKYDMLTDDVGYLVATTDGEEVGGKFGKLYSGYKLRYYEYEDSDRLTAFIANLCKAGKGDAIAFIYSYPSKYLNLCYPQLGTSGSVITDCEESFSHTFTFPHVYNSFSDYSKNNTYLPYNNKLLTYPYNFITVTAPNGSNVVLKYENFSDPSKPRFQVDSVLSQNPTFSLVPKNYCGKEISLEDSIEINGFGLCSWNNDAYANWYAQNQNSIRSQSQNAYTSYRANETVSGNNYANGNRNADLSLTGARLNAGANALGGLGQLASGNLLGGVSSIASTGLAYTSASLSDQQTRNSLNNDLANSNLMNKVNYQNTINSLMASVQDAKVQPNTCKGDTSACGLDVSRDTNTFFLHQTMIKPEYAKSIDMYFQIYGYKLNVIDDPTKYLDNRNRWNYIKTVGCIVTGEIPHMDRREIESLFDNGITIWHHENVMYNYNVNNTILNKN